MFGWIPPWLRRTFAVLVVGLVVWLFVVPQFGAAREAVDAVREISPWQVALAVVLAAFAFVAQAEMTRRVIPSYERPSLVDMLRIELASAAVSHTVPGGTAAGTALGFRLLQQAGTSGAHAGLAAGVRGIGSAMVLNAILWLALLAWIPTRGFSPQYAVAGAVGLVGLAVGVALTVALVRAPAWTTRLLERIAGWLPLVPTEPIAGGVARISAQLRRLLTDRAIATRVVTWAALHWLSQAAALWLLLHAFGWDAGMLGVLVAFGLVNVLAAVPVTPRGLGLVEAVLVPMLVGFGSPAHIATLATVSWRLLTFWLPIPLGGLSYLSILVHRPDVGEGRPEARRRAGAELAEARRSRGAETLRR